ncbi:hypothetical protein A2U01_0110775, partial [Trifolium medium]|nr:hypothetical protein [Trifolium medium]
LSNIPEIATGWLVTMKYSYGVDKKSEML